MYIYIYMYTSYIGDPAGTSAAVRPQAPGLDQQQREPRQLRRLREDPLVCYNCYIMYDITVFYVIV